MDLAADNQQLLINVNNVSFRYDSVPVLEEVSFHIHSGDFLAIIGPNGSGKTTLIKIILGLLEPTQGEVQILGKALSEFSEWQKIGYVPQKATHFDPFFPVSVREVVAMGLLSQKRFPGRTRKEEEELIQKALEQVGMDSFKNRPISLISFFSMSRQQGWMLKRRGISMICSTLSIGKSRSQSS